MATCGIEITPEDFFRKVVRTNGTDYAIAVTDKTADGDWASPLSCPDGITWKDIVMLVYNEANESQNIVIV
jgi:hypothetical protein